MGASFADRNLADPPQPEDLERSGTGQGQGEQADLGEEQAGQQASAQLEPQEQAATRAQCAACGAGDAGQGDGSQYGDQRRQAGSAIGEDGGEAIQALCASCVGESLVEPRQGQVCLLYTSPSP
ncbi:hypothetical protein ACQUHV_25560, partial [Pseudomonas aeruginosa]|uniref:hypothetical protein n=1 Tax=Pseudomonas aeruginosa TaxID=287 RepID=UPI003FD41BE8